MIDNFDLLSPRDDVGCASAVARQTEAAMRAFLAERISAASSPDVVLAVLSGVAAAVREVSVDAGKPSEPVARWAERRARVSPWAVSATRG